jgi:hypothetical protein
MLETSRHLDRLEQFYRRQQLVRFDSREAGAFPGMQLPRPVPASFTLQLLGSGSG